ncbi:cyclin-H-like [Watersipora subatra]|uniref:cyclin-H-like n=1 Tax=Watersipora subatra TaxID=2589382 RepID=UPI00355C6747
MFASSTQRTNWIFSDEGELKNLKQEVNAAYVQKHGGHMHEDPDRKHFLTIAEQDMLVQHYEWGLRAFCKSFRPPMPSSVLATAMVYLKRIYLRHSVMDYHPRDIITTCAYLACKVDEFNVSLREFVGNLKKDREKVSDQILWFELTLMQMLNFHLTVHTAYRPLEGLFINLKTHSPDMDVERLRPNALQFLDTVLFTNAYLLYAPSQIALAALMDSATRANINLTYFLTEHLMRGTEQRMIEQTLKVVKGIGQLVSLTSKPNKDQVKRIDTKLDKCRNQELNPNHELFKRKMRDLDDDDDQQQLQLYQQNSEEQLKMEQDLMTIH